MRFLFSILLITLLAPADTYCQVTNPETKHFENASLAFDYPADWKVDDSSVDDLPRFTIATADGAVEIGIVISFGAEQCDFQAAGKQIINNWLEPTAKKIRAARPLQTAPVKTHVASLEVDGLQIRGLISKRRVTSEFYSFRFHLHIVTLAYLRADDDARAEPAWEIIRKTLTVSPHVVLGVRSAAADLSTETATPAKHEPITSNVINGKAVRLVQPAYPAIARQAHASGTVGVQVLIDESGDVIAAHAVKGHPLLQAAAVAAAKASKFSSTKMCGEPVRVAGVIEYHFVAQ